MSFIVKSCPPNTCCWNAILVSEELAVKSKYISDECTLYCLETESGRWDLRVDITVEDLEYLQGALLLRMTYIAAPGYDLPVFDLSPYMDWDDAHERIITEAKERELKINLEKGNEIKLKKLEKYID